MFSYFILILLTLFLYASLKKISSQYLENIKIGYDTNQNTYDELLVYNAKLKQDNEKLKTNLEQTIALYDITKHICKYLDESKVFGSFSDEIEEYLHLADIKFIKGDIDLSCYRDYTILPLSIDTHHIGYLLAKGVTQPEKEKFNILANQFLLGVRRSLLYQKVQELAITDSLTGILSRRYFLERFYEELERSKKFKYALAFLMVDIDHFKEYNDRYGHLVGDVLLKEASRIIKENLRQIDLVGRYGGEEFSIILTETGKEGAMFAAERIRQSIENQSIRAYDEDLKVTLSAGISIFPLHGQGANSLIERADQALYQAKQTGRNRVCVFK